MPPTLLQTDQVSKKMRPPFVGRSILSVSRIFVLLMIPSLSVKLAISATTMPRQIGEMSIQEIRDEAHHLYADDLPYARYIKLILDRADQNWALLEEREQIVYATSIYSPVLEALRYEHGLIALPADEYQRRYLGEMRISAAFAASNLPKESADFHKEVFLSSSFQRSNSIYRVPVIDLWRQFETKKLQPPYVELLALNQWGIGHGGQQGWMFDIRIADLYAQCGQMVTAAEWYEKVPAEGLGPLKAADAFFAAGEYAEAERLYHYCVAHIDQWRDRQPMLKQTALAEPLESMNYDQTKEHINRQLTQIDQLLTP